MNRSADRSQGAMALGWLLMGALILVAVMAVGFALLPGPLDTGPGLERETHRLHGGIVGRELAAPLLESLTGALQVALLAALTVLLGAFTAWASRRFGIAVEQRRTDRLLVLAELAVIGAEQQGVPAAAAATEDEPEPNAPTPHEVQQARKGWATEALREAAQREGLRVGESLAGRLVEAALGRLKKVL